MAPSLLSVSPRTFAALAPLSHSLAVPEPRGSGGRVSASASSRAEDKRGAMRFDRISCDARMSELGVHSRSKATVHGEASCVMRACQGPQEQLRECTVCAESEPGYGPSSSSSSSRNQLPDNSDEDSASNEAERPEDASKNGPEADESKTLEQLEQERVARQREELARKVMEEARAKKEAEILFQMSQQAYGRGVYDKSVEMLEAALTKVPGGSNLGGELEEQICARVALGWKRWFFIILLLLAGRSAMDQIQIWLAMAYEAVGRHNDCIALYKRLEGGHPNKILRRQAADLRYILEAPKLKISSDEMVKIPLIEKDFDRKAKTWSQTMKDKKKRPFKKAPSSWDYLDDWMVWKPPRWEKSPYFWVALTIWLTLVGVSLIFQK